MTNQPYNLDDATEFFEFTLKGNKYKMRYPTTEEVEKAQKDQGKDQDPQKIQEWMFSFIEPVDDAPDFKGELKKSSVKVLTRFNQMIEAEFMDGQK